MNYFLSYRPYQQFVTWIYFHHIRLMYNHVFIHIRSKYNTTVSTRMITMQPMIQDVLA